MSPQASADGLVTHFDRPLPAVLAVGRGTVLWLSGRCYHRSATLTSLHVVTEAWAYRVANHSRTRADVPADDPAIGDTVPNSLTSGFWVALPFPAVPVEHTIELALRAELHDGTTLTAPLGTLRLLPANHPRTPRDERSGADARVAICVTTCDPDPTSFVARIAAIRGQTHRNWICMIADDASAPDRLRMMQDAIAGDSRFRLMETTERRGGYGNVERVLGDVPADADVVVLSGDGAAPWPPETVRAMLVRLQGAIALAAASAHERPDGRDLARLALGRGFRAAASAFRATLLDDLLPFPPRIGDECALDWIACVAATVGELAAVATPRPTWDEAGTHPPPPSPRDRMGGPGRAPLERRLMAELWRSRAIYETDVVRAVVTARVLLLRLGARTTPANRAMLERIAALETTPLGLVRHALTHPTFGAVWHGLRGVAADRLLDLHYRRHRDRLFAERVVRRELTGGSVAVRPTAGVELVEGKIAPLRLRVRTDEPRRVNLLAPAIDFAHLFAGYLGKLHLALRLTDVGQRVRIVMVDPCDGDLPAWRRAIADYPGLEALFERVEVVSAADRSVALAVHPDDTFIATTWWTAHLAHGAIRELGRERFVYLVQEYEPLTFPMGSLHALAAESYALPHRALFSTTFLRDYFRAQHLGVFAEDAAGGDGAALTFENAITSFAVTAASLARPGPRRLLFYARPEQHAARNMFELGILALRRAVADGVLASDGWILEGMGGGRAYEPVPLGHGQRLTLLPRLTLAAYRTALPRYDVGLSLMLTPHPSLVPLEMAAAGLLTVTNTFANKTAAALQALSTNLIATPPTIGGIHAGLVAAVAQVGDLERRVAGSRVAWSSRWSDSFDDRLLAELGRWLA